MGRKEGAEGGYCDLGEAFFTARLFLLSFIFSWRKARDISLCCLCQNFWEIVSGGEVTWLSECEDFNNSCVVWKCLMRVDY